MKKLDNECLYAIETNGTLKSEFNIFCSRYGKLHLDEKISFYEYKEICFCIIDRLSDGGHTVYQYKNKEEGNQHFVKIKAKCAEIGAVIRRETLSFQQ